jgi:hypothetical protein
MRRSDVLYVVTASGVAGWPRGTVLSREQLLPNSGTIEFLLSIGAIEPVIEVE